MTMKQNKKQIIDSYKRRWGEQNVDRCWKPQRDNGKAPLYVQTNLGSNSKKRSSTGKACTNIFKLGLDAETAKTHGMQQRTVLHFAFSKPHRIRENTTENQSSSTLANWGEQNVDRARTPNVTMARRHFICNKKHVSSSKNDHRQGKHESKRSNLASARKSNTKHRMQKRTACDVFISQNVTCGPAPLTEYEKKTENRSPSTLENGGEQNVFRIRNHNLAIARDHFICHKTLDRVQTTQIDGKQNAKENPRAGHRRGEIE